MPPISYIFLFALGLAVGSFLNVVIFRYQPGKKVLSFKSIGGPGNWGSRSQCMACEKQLKWYELIPLASFLIQGGKCRGCGARISFQYFTVELLSGLVFVFVPMYWAYALPLLQLQSVFYEFIALSVVWILIFLLFIVLSAIDFRHFIIPDSVNFALAVLGLAVIAINDYFNRFTFFGGSFIGNFSPIFGMRDGVSIWVNYIFAAAAMMIFFGLIIFATRGRGMGWGDFKLIGAMGLIYGWPDVMIAALLAFVVGALMGLASVFSRYRKIKDAIPFGPFLVFGGLAVFFFGRQMLEWYFKIFGL